MAKRTSRKDTATAAKNLREIAQWILNGKNSEEGRRLGIMVELYGDGPPTKEEIAKAKHDLATVEEELLGLQDKALKLWKKDETTAKELGETLLKIKKLLPHGEFGRWWRKEKLDQNRVSYCMRLAEDKVADAKAKATTSPRTKALLTITKKLRKLYDLAKANEIQRAKELLKEIDAEIEERFFNKPKALGASAGA